MLYQGYQGDNFFSISYGSILVGTTTGFYSISFEPFEDLVVGINSNNTKPNVYLNSYPNPGIDNIYLKTNCVLCKSFSRIAW